MKNATAIIIVIIILGIGGYFIFRGKPVSGPEKTAPNTPPQSNTNQNTPPAGETTQTPTVRTFDVNGGSYYFTPSTITVKKGDTVKINFKNDGGVHDFKIDEFNVATARIGSGQMASVSFVADKVGSFEYYCSIGSHRSMGMKGTLTVE